MEAEGRNGNGAWFLRVKVEMAMVCVLEGEIFMDLLSIKILELQRRFVHGGCEYD